MKIAPIAMCLVLAACAGQSDSYPSLAPRAGETPREIKAPGAAIDAGLSAEEKARVASRAKAVQIQLDKVHADVTAAAAELTQALNSARGAAAGNSPWSSAQIALSRFEVARSAYAEVSSDLMPLRPLVDGLPYSDADRQTIERLSGLVEKYSEEAQNKAETAKRQLAF